MITARRLDIKQHRMLADFQFRSEDRFDVGTLRCLGELDRAMQVAKIGQGNRRHAILFGKANDGGRRKRRVEKGVVTAHT